MEGCVENHASYGALLDHHQGAPLKTRYLAPFTMKEQQNGRI